MIAHKKEFVSGIGMLLAFLIVLLFVFMPIFNGHNGLEYLDSLYNSISKGSAYYIPKIKKETDTFKGTLITATISFDDKKQALDTAALFKKGGAEATVSDARVAVSGDLGMILENCLVDAESMYNNDGEKVRGKYGYNERQVLYNWWEASKGMEKSLKKQKKFKEAKVISLVTKKAVESSYNYYGIEPQKITDRFGTVIFSLIFYVIYTLWYGFAVMFMFEGWGLKLAH